MAKEEEKLLWPPYRVAIMICFMKLDLDWVKEDGAGKGAVHECNVNCRIAGHRRTKS